MDIIIIASSMLVPTDGTWGYKFAIEIYGFIMGIEFHSRYDAVSDNSLDMLLFKQYDAADRITKETGRGVTVLNSRLLHKRRARWPWLLPVRMNRVPFFVS